MMALCTYELGNCRYSKSGYRLYGLGATAPSEINVKDVTLIMSGGAKGIDTFAKIFAAHHHISLREYLPDYAKHGRYATLLRNTLIVSNSSSSIVVAFPSPDSRGTFHSLKEGLLLGKRVIVIDIPAKAA